MKRWRSSKRRSRAGPADAELHHDFNALLFQLGRHDQFPEIL